MGPGRRLQPEERTLLPSGCITAYDGKTKGKGHHYCLGAVLVLNAGGPDYFPYRAAKVILSLTSDAAQSITGINLDIHSGNFMV